MATHPDHRDDRKIDITLVPEEPVDSVEPVSATSPELGPPPLPLPSESGIEPTDAVTFTGLVGQQGTFHITVSVTSDDLALGHTSGVSSPGLRSAEDRSGWDGVTPLIRRLPLMAGTVSALALCGLTYAWFVPTVQRVANGGAFGCGSVAHPNADPIAEAFCAVPWGQQRLASGLLAVLVVFALVAMRLALTSPARKIVASAAVSAVPVLLLGVFQLYRPLQVIDGQGNLVPCGSAIATTRDALAVGLCSDLPGHYRVAGACLIAAALVILLSLARLVGLRRSA